MLSVFKLAANVPPLVCLFNYTIGIERHGIQTYECEIVMCLLNVYVFMAYTCSFEIPLSGISATPFLNLSTR